MYKFERNLIVLILISFIGAIFFNFWGISIILYLEMVLLAISYFLFGNYFFNKTGYSQLIRVTSGFTLAGLIISLVYSLNLKTIQYSKIISIFGIVYSFILIIIWLIKKTDFSKELKLIFFRLFILSLITSFFSFSSIYNNTNRYIIKNLADQESLLYYNILMFDEVKKQQSAFGSNNLDAAIQASKKAIDYGKKWKDYNENEYIYFSGAYEMLYKSYSKKASNFFDKKEYNDALKNYLLVDSILQLKEYKTESLKAKKRNLYWNRFNILKSYNKIEDYNLYDIELDYIINNYKTHNDSININYYYILENMIDNYYKRDFYSGVIELNKTSLEILKKDSINNLDYFSDRYLSLIKTYVATDSINNSKKYLEKYKSVAKNKTCLILLYTTLINEKSNINNALLTAKECFSCFSKEEKIIAQNVFMSSILLSKIHLSNSNYSEFKNQLKITEDWLNKSVDYLYNRPLLTLLESNYHYIIGNYKIAQELYLKTKKEYQAINILDENLLFIDLKIAILKDELGDQFNRELLNKKGLNYLSESEYTFPSKTEIYNDLGNLNINFNPKLSDSLFNITINSHTKYKIKNQPNIGVALNGLGLIELNKRNYKKADSLFLKSLEQFDAYYSKNTNFNQIISYLNITESNLKQKNISVSSYYLNKAIQTTNKCFGDNESIYKFYTTKLNADLLLLNKKEKLAIIELEKALQIGKKYFHINHDIILELIEKINQSNF